MSQTRCSKRLFRKWSHALAWATVDEQLHGDKRKVYWCRKCNEGYHVSRERVKTDVPITER